MLSDRDIREAVQTRHLQIDNAGRPRLQPSSVDLTLGDELLVFTGHDSYVDPKIDSADLFERQAIPLNGYEVLPHEFLLATTAERVRLSDCLVARVEGKSSLGRLGLLVHCTAGFVDAGFDGQITLELYNALPVPIVIYPGMPICQLAFDWLDTPAENPYTGKYQGQAGPVASRYHRNWNRELNAW